MTSCAMIAGMVPMALGWSEGGEQTAPLGRAVIGGLVAATLATLIVLPTVFALVQGWAGRESASLDPDDPGEPALPRGGSAMHRDLARPSGNGEPQALEPRPRPAGPSRRPPTPTRVADLSQELNAMPRTTLSVVNAPRDRRDPPGDSRRAASSRRRARRGRRPPPPVAIASRSSTPSGRPSAAASASRASSRRSRPRRSTPRSPAT